jgi:hypothetical protein
MNTPTKEVCMKKYAFLIFLLIVVFLLTGWIYSINAHKSQSEPVQQISTKWWGSAHADIAAEAFTHWNEDEPAEVPQYCAKCHSGQGFIDYLGQDGSEAFSVDEPAAIESVISCEVCHNEQAEQLSTVNYPSGASVALEPNDALCATCHSGLDAGTAVVDATSGFTDDEIIPDGSFITPHYAFASATWLGSEGNAGYEYTQKEYVGRFEHAVGVQTCTQCHDAHSLHINTTQEGADLCSTCHSNVTGYSDYRNITFSGIDYDNDGVVEGMYHEIEGVRSILYQAMQRYASEVLGESIGWLDQYPYLFKDSNSDGVISEEEAAFSNAYSSFSPRLMRTAFNFQFSLKDPAGYVHNGKYVLQLLFDSIEDLSDVVAVDCDLSLRP